MSFELKRLQEQRDKIASDMRAIVTLAEKEDRGLSSDERENWDGLNTDLEAQEGRIDVCKRQNQIDLENAAKDAEKREEDKTPEQRDEVTHADAFDAVVRSVQPGTANLSAEVQKVLAEHRAQSVGTDSAGGFTVPEGFRNTLEEAMLQFGGVETVANVFSTESGNDLPMPTNNDTGNTGAILAENTQDSEQDTTFGVVTLGAFKYTSRIVRVPYELLQDSAFDMNTFLANKLGERIGRIWAAHLALGTGSGQPNGVGTAATTGVTAAANTAITYANLIDLKHSVDPAYRANAAFAFNDDIFRAIKGLLDGDSRPLWQPAIGSEVPATIDGDRYVIDQGFDGLGAAGTAAIYGDMSKYMVRRVRDITLVRMVERYADFHQVGFVAFFRGDADLLDAGTNPIKRLVLPS